MSAEPEHPQLEGEQGRRRVYLACGACRARKIKCDGARPICTTCVRRKNAQCLYDEVPIRRGPDRRPRRRPLQLGTSRNSNTPPSVSAPRRSGSGSASTSANAYGTWSTRNTSPARGGSTSAPAHETSNVTASQGQMHPPPLNTPAPPISTLYSAGDHQSYQLRAPAKMLHQGLSPPPRSVASSSSSSNYTAGSHLPPLAAAAATTHPPPSPARGLSYILNPTEKENQIENPDSNVHVQQNSRNYLRNSRVSVGRRDEPFLGYFDPHQGQQQFPTGPSIIDPQSMASARTPNKANVASTGDALIEQGIQDVTIPGYRAPRPDFLPGLSISLPSAHDPCRFQETLGQFVEDATSTVNADSQIYASGAGSHEAYVRECNADGDDNTHAVKMNTNPRDKISSVAPSALSAFSPSGANKYSEFYKEPDLQMTRANWWQELVALYHPNAEIGNKLVMTDIAHLFKVSSYFVSFMNVSLFMSAFHLHEHRMNLQPSLVYSVLALSTFMKSSDLEDGQTGRQKALIFRTMAQISLEQSINCNFITPGLAQAAFILVLFEMGNHAEQADDRGTSMMRTLDSIIRSLGFLELDRNDPQLTRFGEYQVTTVIQPQVTEVPYDTVHAQCLATTASAAGELRPMVGSDVVGLGPQTLSHSTGQMADVRCSCALFEVSSMNPQSAKSTPFWLGTPGWNSSWPLVEMRYEEHRRLVWCALMLATGFVNYNHSLGHPPPDLAITKPWMFKVLFPGETLFRGNNPRSTYVLPGSKNSVWALHARSQLLYASAVHIKYSHRLSEQAKAEFAVRAWLEAEQIETQLNMHTCNIERATLYSGREYLFNTQNLVSSRFTSYVPHPYLGNGSFYREKVANWLARQRRVADLFLSQFEPITGLLAKRPYFVFWFFNQVARHLTLWHQDNTLTMALELAKRWLPLLEYLMSIYPSEKTLARYFRLHASLEMACLLAGTSCPPAPSFDAPVRVLV